MVGPCRGLWLNGASRAGAAKADRWGVGQRAVAATMTILVDTVDFCGCFFTETSKQADRKPKIAMQDIALVELYTMP
jgi:hypothetical protein